MMEYYINIHRSTSDAPHAIAFRTRRGALEALAEDYMEGGVQSYQHTLTGPVSVTLYTNRKHVFVLDLEDEARALADEWRDDAKEPARLKAAHEARVL